MKVRIFVTLTIFAFISLEATAADSINPGTYTTEGGWGNLNVSRASPNSPLSFSIFTTGANAHMCQVEGEIRNNQGIASKENCVIQFEVKRDRVTIKGGSGCLDECGSNTIIDGDYFPQDSLCGDENNIREEFKRQYQSGKYHQAQKLLTELLGKCEGFMDWRSQTEIRNDLAITYLHLGDKPACLKTLEPLKEWFIDDLSNTGRWFRPADEDWGNAMVKSTRFNWKKCGGTFK